MALTKVKSGMRTLGTGEVTSTNISDGTISNNDIDASAAIAQSKLSLDITNSDINASAAIAQSKLANVPYYTSSATEPASPSAGDIWYDSANNSMKNYAGTAWATMSTPPLTATGGTITTSGSYKVHTFTSSGTFQITAGSGTVDYLVVAGGGGGGRSNGASGAGGAGGLLTNSFSGSTNSYTVTVGAGGSGITSGFSVGGTGSSVVAGAPQLAPE